MTKVAVNFTGVNDVPEGELLLKVEKADTATSQNGNPTLKLQCAIIAAEDERWVGHKLFPVLNLSGDMKRFTFQALEAFGLDVPEGEMSFDTDDLVGKETWVFAKANQRPDGQGLISNVKRWGIDPEHAEASIS